MFDWLQSPAIALLVLAVLGLEAVLLFFIWNSRKRGLMPLETISFLGAGACFATCLYVVLSNAATIWIGVALTGAFAFHLLDLKLRWRG